MSPITADGDIAGLALLAAGTMLTARSCWPARARRRAPLPPVSVEDRVPGAAPLQLEEAVSLGDQQDAVPQPGRRVAARDR
jgi:hypothetical protein